MVSFEATLTNLYSSVWYLAIPVTKAQANEVLKPGSKERRVICTINDSHTWHAALMPDGKGAFFINIGKEARKKGDIEEGDTVAVKLEVDNSEYGMPVPEEIVELWAIDEPAFEVFHTLTPGKQRSLLHIVGKVKSSEIRARKAVQIMEYLKSTGGKLDFKELNQALKQKLY